MKLKLKLLVVALLAIATAVQPAFADRFLDHAKYQRTVLWERYYAAGKQFQRAGDRNKAGQYFDAAFAEAEKWFAINSRSANQEIKLDLDLLALELMQPFMDSMFAAVDEKDHPLVTALRIQATSAKIGGKQKDTYKRLWKLFANACGPDDSRTLYYKKMYENGKST